VPHLLKEIKALGTPGAPDYRAARIFDGTTPKLVTIPAEQHQLVVEGMWGVVNNGGTAAVIKMPGFDIAGKTGTAQVVGLGKDVGANKDHSWFVSYAPAFKPEISAIALIENVGFGARFAAPAVRAVYDVYYRKTRGEEAAAQQIAQNNKQTAKNNRGQKAEDQGQ
jgi:penicillin-binding protein 2